MNRVKTAFAALALSATIAATATTASAETEVRLVLPHPNMAVGEEVFLYAVPKALGFFKDEGIDVRVMTANGSVAAGQIMISGGAEIAPMLAEALVSIREQGGTPKAFYSLKRNNGFTVAVLPDSPIKTLDDVAGKTIGFSSAGSGSDKMLAEQLRADGVTTAYKSLSLGTGPGVINAIRSGQVDALMMWDAIYAIYENQGLKLKHYEIPLQDKLAGYTVASTEKYMADNPKVIAGFCRASAKALYFTTVNPTKAVDIFYTQFPSLLPAGKSRDEAIADGVNIMKSWLERAQKGVPFGEKTGYEDPARWAFTAELYAKFGQLKGTTDVKSAYTDDYFEKCNDFDRRATEALAKQS